MFGQCRSPSLEPPQLIFLHCPPPFWRFIITNLHTLHRRIPSERLLYVRMSYGDGTRKGGSQAMSPGNREYRARCRDWQPTKPSISYFLLPNNIRWRKNTYVIIEWNAVKQFIFTLICNFCNFGRNDNSLIVRKTKKQMILKHMKQWNNREVHSSFHPGRGYIQNENARDDRLGARYWPRKIGITEKLTPHRTNNSGDANLPVNDRIRGLLCTDSRRLARISRHSYGPGALRRRSRLNADISSNTGTGNFPRTKLSRLNATVQLQCNR